MADFDGKINSIKPGMLTIIGIPYDANSSFMRGPALAPARIRSALYSGSINLCSENRIDLSSESCFMDLGDITFNDRFLPFEQIEKIIEELLEQKAYVISLGGDHSITYPIIKAYSKKYQGLNILHLDAHPDLYDEYGGSRFSHACPFARIMEQKLAKRLVQVGIRTMNPHQYKQVQKYGVEVFEMKNWQSEINLEFEGPLYLSLDMDVLDPAFAPGVSHHEPGGLSTRDVIGLIQSLDVPLVGGDLVELNPERDPAGITAMAAAKLLKELSAAVLKNNPG